MVTKGDFSKTSKRRGLFVVINTRFDQFLKIYSAACFSFLALFPLWIVTNGRLRALGGGRAEMVLERLSSHVR